MDDPQKWFDEGVALYEKGDYKRAVSAFDKAIAADPSKAEFWNNRGLALIQLEKYPEALDSVNRALAISPGYEHAKKAKKIVLDLTKAPDSSGTSPDGAAGTLPPAGQARRSPVIMAAVIVIAICLVATAGIMLTKNPSDPGAIRLPFVGTTPPTPVPTTLPTAIPTPTPVPTPTPKEIPGSGVWVEVNYDQYYSGSVGIPGNQQQLSGTRQVKPNTGDQFYPIARNNGIVTATVSKNDGSGDRLTVTVYSEGVTVRNESTVLPYGVVDIVATIPAATPTADAGTLTAPSAAGTGA